MIWIKRFFMLLFYLIASLLVFIWCPLEGFLKGVGKAFKDAKNNLLAIKFHWQRADWL